MSKYWYACIYECIATQMSPGLCKAENFKVVQFVSPSILESIFQTFDNL